MLNITVIFEDDPQGRSQNFIAKYIISQRMKILYSEVYEEHGLIIMDLLVKTNWFQELKPLIIRHYQNMRNLRVDVRSITIKKT